MKKTFREHHLLKILETFSLGPLPLDVHLGNYFRAHSALGSKDRQEISEKIYMLIRWLSLIDYHAEGSHSWEERIKVLQQIDLKKKRKDPSVPPHIRASFPKSFFALLSDTFGEEKALEFCYLSNQEAPMTIRTNLLKTTRCRLLAQLQESYAARATAHSLWGIQFEKRAPLQTFSSFQLGHFEVQDEASQLAANLLEAEPGHLVLDYCAGAGGKTLAFAHKLQGKGQIYLHDVRAKALEKAKRRLKRAGIENAQILSFDAPYKGELKGKMDWIFVDVPCSGSGTLRRNPDLKWKFTLQMLEDLVREQRAIFQEALSFLKPSGKMIYATCSVLPAENEEQIAYFERTHGLTLLKKPFQSWPSEGGMDGFFAATLSLSTC